MTDGNGGVYSPPDPDETLWNDDDVDDAVDDYDSRIRDADDSDVPHLREVVSSDELAQRRRRRIEIEAMREIARQELEAVRQGLLRASKAHAAEEGRRAVSRENRIYEQMQTDGQEMTRHFMSELDSHGTRVGNSISTVHKSLRASIPKPVSDAAKIAAAAALLMIVASIATLSIWHVQTQTKIVTMETSVHQVVSDAQAVVEPFHGLYEQVEQNTDRVADLRARQSLDDGFREEAGDKLSALQLDFDLHKEEEIGWRESITRILGSNKRSIERTRETASALSSVAISNGSGNYNEAMWNERASSSLCPNPDPGSRTEREVIRRSSRYNGGRPVRACHGGFNTDIQYFLYCSSAKRSGSGLRSSTQFVGCRYIGPLHSS